MSNISVIVPVYKVEKYLDRCVESIVNQTYSDFELILVDDGSPDSCPAMCDKWSRKDSRIRVIHKENGGLSSARNAGMDIMQGEYVCFVDSDDWVERNFLESLILLFREYPLAEIAACASRRDKETTKKLIQPEKAIKVCDKKEMLDSFYRVHGEPSNTGVWNKLIKASILKNFRFVITLNEDVEASYEFYTRASCMVETNQILHHYFMNDSGITRSKFSIKDLVYLEVWDRVVTRTQKEHPEYLQYAVLGRKRANFTMLSKMLLRGYDKQDQELCAVRKKLKSEVRKDYFQLMKWKMPLSRKMLLTLECI